MGFREWLFYELQNDGYIEDETDLDVNSYDVEDLLNSTDFEMINMSDYVQLYEEYCSSRGIKPVMDLELPEE